MDFSEPLIHSMVVLNGCIHAESKLKIAKMLANRNIKKHIISSRVLNTRWHFMRATGGKKRFTLCCLPAESTYEHFAVEKKTVNVHNKEEDSNLQSCY